MVGSSDPSFRAREKSSAALALSFLSESANGAKASQDDWIVGSRLGEFIQLLQRVRSQRRIFARHGPIGFQFCDGRQRIAGAGRGPIEPQQSGQVGLRLFEGDVGKGCPAKRTMRCLVSLE